MPDWSYQPLFRPLLFRLPPATARDLTLGAIGRLAELPLGSAVIRFMGHMEPPDTLKRTAFGLAFPGPAGLGAGLDAHVVALPALAQFGFGFLEVGPVTVEPVRSATQIERRGRQAAIWYPAAPVNDGLEALAGRLARAAPLPVPVGVRLAHRPGADAEAATVERRRMIARLTPYADFFTLDTRWGADGWSAAEWTAHLTAMRDAARDRASARSAADLSSRRTWRWRRSSACWPRRWRLTSPASWSAAAWPRGTAGWSGRRRASRRCG